MMDKIYMDNGSTSFPKAPGVGDAMRDFIENVGVNIARGGYEEAYSAAEVVLETREQLCRLFHWDNPQQVVFTSGVTASLNVLLKGFLHPGDRVMTTSMEHNAVMRPLHQLAEDGVQVEVISCLGDGSLPLDRLEEALKTRPRALVMLHASNVCGTLLPIEEAARLCRQYDVRLIVDSAQTAGIFPIDMQVGIDALAFTGHKGLLGPQGIGGFLLTQEMARQVRPLLAGGTGSLSHKEQMPDFMPDRFEPGTQNLPGIFGLHAALDYLENTGLTAIRQAELARTQQLLEGLLPIDGARVVGRQGIEGRTAAVSVSFDRMDNGEAAFLLENQFGIMTRCGLHCAPRAHKTLGTFPQGTVRFAPGHTTTEEEIRLTLDAIAQVARG